MARQPRHNGTFDVDILSVATAVPPFRVRQDETHAHAARVFPHLDHMQPLYGNTGIETRYFCEAMEWYHTERGWEERTEKYRTHALDLLERVTVDAVAKAGLELADIDILVVNTITGLAIPSLDALLMNRMALRRDVERLPIFGLGCGGGVAGLARTARLAQAQPGAYALFLTVDLCSLCMRPNDKSTAMFVSAALFGDGAAAVVLRSGDGQPAKLNGNGRPPARLTAVGEHCWPETEYMMGWDVKPDGFGVVLSPELPFLMHKGLRPAVDTFLDGHDLALDGFAGYLFHPGGRKVLETAEHVLGIGSDDVRHSWGVLRDYGNMSSATALFVLARALEHDERGSHLLAAFGPGFSAYFAALEL